MSQYKPRNVRVLRVTAQGAPLLLPGVGHRRAHGVCALVIGVRVLLRTTAEVHAYLCMISARYMCVCTGFCGGSNAWILPCGVCVSWARTRRAWGAASEQ